jgi:hypothetical protein
MRRLILAGLAGLALASVPLATASAQHGHYRGDNDGAALGAGLLAGTLLGVGIAASAAPPVAEPVFLYPPNTRLGYCERQLPGFDAASGTYIAPSGRRARCP